MWLNYNEVRYLLHLTAQRYSGLTARGVSLRREVKIADFADWYYDLDFSENLEHHVSGTRIRFSHAPHTDNPAVVGAVWRACAGWMDEALLIQASLSRFRWDYRVGRNETPRCDSCAGTGRRMATQTVPLEPGEAPVAAAGGRRRPPATKIVEVEVACPACKGEGKRLRPYYSGPDFEAFCAALDTTE